MKTSQLKTDFKNLRVPYALAVHGVEEEKAVLKVLKSHKTQEGKNTTNFEIKAAELFGKKYGIMTNSGSSANLLAIELLNLKPGSEVITPILTFSTTLAPLIQKRLKPVFVDVELGSYQIQVDAISEAINKNTKALLIPLLIGNIPDMKKLRNIADEYGLFFIEDSCDTLGGKYDWQPTGTYSDISTTSFYGSHIITAAGGGGMLCLNDKLWDRRARILRGWGRTSSSNETENINIRFSSKLNGNIPYDSKFIFEEIGYNFRPLEISAAFGLEQLKKLKKFTAIRKRNFNELTKSLSKYTDVFSLPVQSQKVETSWLAYPILIKENAPFTRHEIVSYLEKNNVQTRPVFTGNILYQPAFRHIIHKDTKKSYTNANNITKNAFLIGCHHGMRSEHIEKLKLLFEGFLGKFK